MGASYQFTMLVRNWCQLSRIKPCQKKWHWHYEWHQRSWALIFRHTKSMSWSMFFFELHCTGLSCRLLWPEDGRVVDSLCWYSASRCRYRGRARPAIPHKRIFGAGSLIGLPRFKQWGWVWSSACWSKLGTVSLGYPPRYTEWLTTSGELGARRVWNKGWKNDKVPPESEKPASQI